MAVVCELVYRNRIDRPHSMLKTWPVAICKEVVQCTSIVSASAPQFKGFMESLESSGLRLYELPTPKSSRRTASASYQQRSSWSRRTRPTLRRLTPPSREYLEIDSISGRNTAADFEATVTAATRNSNGSLDSRPREPGVIHETITWAVTKEGSQADINR